MIGLILVEDNPITAMSLSLFLEDSSFEVLAEISRGEHVAEKVAELKPELILMDIMLKGKMTGIEAAQEIRKTSDTPILFVSALSDQETMDSINLISNSDSLVKPYDYEIFVSIMQKLLNRSKPDVEI